MEWAILISVVLLYGGKLVLMTDVFLKGTELHQGRQRTRRRARPVTGRLLGETSLNDFDHVELQNIIQNLRREGHLGTRGTGQVPRPRGREEQSSKVDWKREGF